MIPALLSLPATTIDEGIDGLASLLDRVGEGRTVVVGAQRTVQGDELDEFVVATGLAAMRPVCSIGVAARVGAGRAASIVAREATAAQLLGGCDVVLLDGEPARCRDAAVVVGALCSGGTHSIETPTERVDGARNDPAPDVPGGLPVLWRDGTSLFQVVDGVPTVCGDVVVVPAVSRLPAPSAGTLVVLEHPLSSPEELVGALAT
jgi:hypothetical protein